jgi:hypothetical protein
MLYIDTMEHYSVIRKNASMLFAGKWMEVENILVSEEGQAQKVKGHMFSFMCGS